MCPLIAITLSCNTVRIIFVAGLKGDKFKRYLGILSTIVLFVRYVKFELGNKKQIMRYVIDKARMAGARKFLMYGF